MPLKRPRDLEEDIMAALKVKKPKPPPPKSPPKPIEPINFAADPETAGKIEAMIQRGEIGDVDKSRTDQRLVEKVMLMARELFPAAAMNAMGIC